MGGIGDIMEGSMSLPDYLLEDPEYFCACGNEKPDWALYCNECMSDNEDLYADEKISEGRMR